MSSALFDGRDLLVFLGLSVILGGAASFATGRALARRWRPLAQAPAYALLIAAAARFLHYALFGEPLLSPERFGLDFAAAMGFMLAGYKLTRRRQMRDQYGAIFARDHAEPAAAPGIEGHRS
jgi:hypothetical protein